MVNIPNDDVLDHILQTCPTSSLATLSLVSSHIRILALPHLLRTVSFDRNPEEILTFLNFILNNTQKVEDADIGRTGIFGAARYIFKLEILLLAFCVEVPSGDCFDPAEVEYHISIWAPLLALALELMPNLHSIVIQSNVEEIVFHSPDFALALFSRPQLTSIDLGDVGPLASDRFGQALILKKDWIKLGTVKLAGGEGLELIPGAGMGSVLFYLMAHLTEIDFDECDLRNLLHDDEGRNDIKIPVIFPNVVTLSLGGCKVSLKGLASAFPAMRTLNLCYEPFSYKKASPSQTCHISFPSLTSIEGRYRDLCAFFESTGTHGHLRRVVVMGIPRHYFNADNTTPMFSGMRALPGLKSLNLLSTPVMPLSWWTALANTTSHLTYLAISLRAFSQNDLNILCVQVPRRLASAPLAYVSLTLKASPDIIDNKASPEIQSMVAEHALARSYARNIPTLKYIDICKAVLDDRGLTSWWSVVRDSSILADESDDAGVQVKALDAYEGTALGTWYDLEA